MATVGKVLAVVFTAVIVLFPSTAPPQSESSGTLVRLARSTRCPLVPTRVEIGA